MECSFCGVTVDRGCGLTYVKKDAKILHFCGRKCEKNMIQLGRKARTTTWTAQYRTVKKQAMEAGAKTKKKIKKPSPAKTPSKTAVKKTPKAGKNAVKKAKKTPAKTAAKTPAKTAAKTVKK